MKTLSDYKGEEAIELWADLIDPLTAIFSDKEFMQELKGKPPLEIAKEVLKVHKKEATEILLRIDDEPLDGMNLLIRLVALLADIGKNKKIVSFFGSVGQEMSESGHSGSAMENTGDGVK